MTRGVLSLPLEKYPDRMVGEYRFEKVNEAFDEMMNGKPKFRVVLRMGR